MSSPWHGTERVPTPKPGWPHPKPAPEPTKESALLLETYKSLRLDCIELEELIGNGRGLSDKDLKRLDKAVTVMKVSFKIVKKVLRRHGFREMKPSSVFEPSPIYAISRERHS